MLDTNNLESYFSTYAAGDPQAIQHVLHDHNARFAYYMLKALMPKISAAVGLWSERYGRGVDEETLRQREDGKRSLLTHIFQPHIWNDLDRELVIFHSSDLKRILIAELNKSAFSHEYPLVYLEGHGPIAGHDFGMDDLARIEFHEVYRDIPEQADRPGQPRGLRDFVNSVDTWSKIASFPTGDGKGHMDRPSLGWYAEAIESGPLNTPWFNRRLCITQPAPDVEHRHIAMEIEVRNWRFNCSIRELQAAMYMLNSASTALSRGDL